MDGVISNFTNLDTEISIIGSVITDPALIIKCIDAKLDVSDFASKEYGLIYQIMLNLHLNKIDIDLTTIVSELKRLNRDTKISILAEYIAYSVAGNIESYIKIIKELSYKRKLASKMLDFIANARGYDQSKIKGCIDEINCLADNTNSLEMMYEDASSIVKENIQDGLQTGFQAIDYCLNGLVFGSLTILTGEPSSGKSTVLNQIIAHNISEGEKVFVYSGELTEYNVLHWFMRSVANPDHLASFVGRNGQYYDVTSQGEFLIREWIKDRLFIYKQSSIPSIDNLIGTITYLVKNKGIRLVVLDNMMTVDNSGLEELEKQKVLVRKLKKLAQQYKVCVILVAHPKKKEFGKKNYHMHDVSGASEVVNLADYEILLTRDIKETNNERVDKTFMSILKNRTTGIQGISRQLFFNSIRKRFYISDFELERDYRYSNKAEQLEFSEIQCKEVPF